jgi:hypothetical protein
MRGRVLGPDIGLHFHHNPLDLLPSQDGPESAAEEATGDLVGAA